MRRSGSALVLLLALGGCHGSRGVLAVANLRPYEAFELSIHTLQAGSSTLELRQRRQMIEYRIRLDNALNDLVTEAQLYDGDPRNGGVLIGTFFREARVRGRWLHMRGTLQLAESISMETFRERVATAPSQFAVRVKSEGAPGGALIGFLR